MGRYWGGEVRLGRTLVARARSLEIPLIVINRGPQVRVKLIET